MSSMDSSAIQLLHMGVTAALAIVGALIIAPLRSIAEKLADVSERLAHIEGRMDQLDREGWTGEERRRGSKTS